MHIYIYTNPSTRAGFDTQSVSLAEFIGYEFRVFLLLDRLS